MLPVTLTRKQDIPYCYDIQERAVILWMVRDSLPTREKLSGTCHIMRKNTIGLDRLTSII